MRTRKEIDPREQQDLENMMQRARWSMERPTGGCEYNILHRIVDRETGRRVFDIYLVDTTRRGRDRKAGTPVYLGTAPFRNEAEAFIADHAKGKSVFYFRGFRTEFTKKTFEKSRIVQVDTPVATRNLPDLTSK